MEFLGTARFEVIEKLGEGGMGIVYEVYDRTRDSRVALKTLREINATRLYRFKREFRALSNLSHPNIIELYDLHAEGDVWFLTMEIVDGCDLISYVRAGRAAYDTFGGGRSLNLSETTTDTRPSISRILFGRPGEHTGDAGVPKPPEQRNEVDDVVELDLLRDALAQLASALHVLHGAGIVHRDLKPSNVRVTHDGRVVLMDFGVVAERALPEASDMQSARVGTPSFMAPEQAAGEPPSEAADWYAFGVLMFQALTGRRPFEGSSDQVIGAKLKRDPLAPSIFTAGIPEDLELLCRHLLARDPSLRPTGEAVLSRLGAAPASVPMAGRTPGMDLFVGRVVELRALHDAFDEARSGRAQCVLVHGLSGMGKTGLVDRFIGELEAHHIDVPLVLSARCYERERLPYKAFDGAIDALCHYLLDLPAAVRAPAVPADAPLLTRLFPVLRRVPGFDAELTLDGRNPMELRNQAIEALRELLAAISNQAPVMLRIEDLQWADTDSLHLLERLLASPPPGRLLVIATVRAETLADAPLLADTLASLAADALYQSIPVGPLSDMERRELVAKLAAVLMMERDWLSAYIDDAWRESAGSPMLITELARYTKEATAAVGPDAAPTAHAPPRLRLEDVLWERCTHLSASARELLELIAVAGGPQPTHILAAAGELTASACERALSVLRLSHLTQLIAPEPEPSIDTSHDKIREAVLRNLSASRTSELHRRLAASLEAWSSPPPGVAAQIAGHKAAAGENVAAARYLLEAARRSTEQLAPSRALALYEEALTLLPAPEREGADEDREDVEAQIIGCRVRTGLAEGKRVIDRNDEALALLDQAQPVAARHGLLEELATIHYLRGNLLFPRGDLDGCLAQHELALDYARRAGASRAEARAHSGLGDAYYMRGSMISAYQHFDRCVELCRTHGWAGIEVANLSMRGMTRYYQNDLAAALGDSEDAAAMAAAIGQERAEIVARNGCVGWILFEMGRHERARDEFERALEMARDIGARRFEPNSLTWLGKLHARAGDRELGAELIRESVAICRETGFAFVGPMALGALALVTDDASERERAFEDAEAALRKGTASHNYLYFYRDAIDAALATGDVDAAAKFADGLEAYTRREPLPWSQFFIARARVLIAAHRRPSSGGAAAGTRARARDLLDDARRVGLHVAAAALERGVADEG